MTDETLHAEARQFIEDWGTACANTVGEVREIFTQFSQSPHLTGRIYRIYSRGERQNGEELKELWKIAAKLKKMRKKKPSYAPLDLPDIVGLTIVCVYPSDIQIVKDFVISQFRRRIFKKVGGRRATEDGYYAYHYWIKLPKSLYYGPICEVQIKSVLHDAWAAKTHDLTYKPRGELDVRMDRQMTVLGDTLAKMEDQSEIIRELIEERWTLDETKKKAARRAVLQRLDALEEPTIQTIVRDIEKNKVLYGSVPFWSSRLVGVQENILQATGEKYNGISCRLLALLALSRENHDMDGRVLDWLSRWSSASTDTQEKVQALILNGLVLFCFGRVEEAIRIAQQALDLAKDYPEYRFRVKNGLAYYYSELAGSDTGEKLDANANAKKFRDEALAEVEGGTTPALLLDTQGAVLIAFGECAKDVRKGLKLCKKARAAADPAEKELARAFYSIHERRAYRRLSLEWK